MNRPFSEINPLKNTRNFILTTSSGSYRANFQLQISWILALKREQHRSSSRCSQALEEGRGRESPSVGYNVPGTMQVLQFCLQMVIAITAKSIPRYYGNRHKVMTSVPKLCYLSKSSLSK